MYISHTILDFNLICIFGFAFKRTLTLFIYLFCFSRLVLSIWYRSFSSISYSIFSSYSSSALTLLFSCGNLSSTAWLTIAFFFFLSIKFISYFWIVPAVLSRRNCSILGTKVSQDLAFIWWIPGTIYETCGFGYILWIIYIPFSLIPSALIHLRVSIWRGGFSSYFPDVTSTVGTFPSRFLTRRFY